MHCMHVILTKLHLYPNFFPIFLKQPVFGNISQNTIMEILYLDCNSFPNVQRIVCLAPIPGSKTDTSMMI